MSNLPEDPTGGQVAPPADPLSNPPDPMPETWRDLAAAAVRAAHEGDATEQARALRRIRERLHGRRPPDPLAGATLALGDAAEAPDEATAEKLLREALAPPLLRPAVDWSTTSEPPPILWRDAGRDDADPADAVLSAGEVALLSGPGGIGKSYAVLAVAAAAVGAARHLEYGAACGLRVAPAPVVLVSYEDAPARIAARLRMLNRGSVPSYVHLWPDPEPLFALAPEAPGKVAPCDRWADLWAEVRAVGARLVVIDPASAALQDTSTSETGPVRAFLRALTAEAAPNPTQDWPGCGVLLVAHDTKAARNAVARGEDPGAGVVAGSAAWYDGSRGVLSLTRDPMSDDRLLECVKANYGRTGWGVRLRERTSDGGAFCGLELAARLTRADLDAAKKPPAKEGRRQTSDRTGATANGAGASDTGDLSAF